jgi:hypothetical protein
MANPSSKRQKKSLPEGETKVPKYTSARKLLNNQRLAPPMQPFVSI